MSDTPAPATTDAAIGNAFGFWLTHNREDPGDHPTADSYAECVFGAGFAAGVAEGRKLQIADDIRLAEQVDARWYDAELDAARRDYPFSGMLKIWLADLLGGRYGGPE